MVIATAATTAVVSSATDDEGLINQGFKLAILIGLALAIATGIFLIYTLSNVFQPAVDLLTSGGSIFRAAFSLTPLGGITSGITYLLSGAFGRN
jgi:hypothetical protein